MSDPEAVLAAVRDELSTVLIGNDAVVDGLAIALLTQGHVLLEGVPGVAKTTIANLFARASGLQYTRIQMTPDMLPADVTGTHIYRDETGQFELQKGPVFANLVVADEINRATPKTQSALLEAMEERTVTIEGQTLPLPEPFMVIATQNPIEMEGVYSLPEAQRDRFQFKLTVDLPDREMETAILDRFDADPQLGPDAVEQVVSPEDLLAARETVADVYIDDAVKDYILDIVAATRDDEAVEHGASPRASLAFQEGAKARAAVNGRDYVIPGDVKALIPWVLRHRIVLSTDAELSERTPDDIIADIEASVTPPSAEEGLDALFDDEGEGSEGVVGDGSGEELYGQSTDEE